MQSTIPAVAVVKGYMDQKETFTMPPPYPEIFMVAGVVC